MSLKFKQIEDGSWIGYRAGNEPIPAPKKSNDAGEPGDDDLEIDATSLAEMDDEQLAEYAERVGVDISRCTTRNGVIGKLEKAKQEQGAE